MDRIKETWAKYYESSDSAYVELIAEGPNIKVYAKKEPLYETGWEVDYETGTNRAILECKAQGEEEFSPLNGKEFFAVITCKSMYEYVETRRFDATRDSPAESYGYYTSRGDKEFGDLDDSFQFYETIEDAKKAMQVGPAKWENGTVDIFDAELAGLVEISDNALSLLQDPEDVKIDY